MNRTAAVFLAIAVSSCAAEQPPLVHDNFHRASTTSQQLAKDRYDCIRDAQQNRASGGFYKGSGSVREETVISRPVFVTCMSAKGYAITRDGKAPNFVDLPPSTPPIVMIGRRDG